MKNVERIIILYPGETSTERIDTPGDYSLSRLLVRLHEPDSVPIYFLNWSPRAKRYGSIEFIHFATFNFLKLLARLTFQRRSLIVSQTGAYGVQARILRALMPGSRILVRLGGVYPGKQYLESPTFGAARRALRWRLAFRCRYEHRRRNAGRRRAAQRIGSPLDSAKKLAGILANMIGSHEPSAKTRPAGAASPQPSLEHAP